MLIKEFLNQVCQQIQYQPIRQQISEEIENHLRERKEMYLTEGMSENEAEREAVRQMGEAEEIGQKLNRIHRPQLDWKLLLITIILLIFGGLVGFTRKQNFGQGANSLYQYGFGIVIGMILAVVVYFIDYRKIFKFPQQLYSIATLLMILILTFGTTINGAKTYVSFGGIHIFVPMLVIPIYMLAFIGWIQNIHTEKVKNINFFGKKEITIYWDYVKIAILSGLSLLLLEKMPATTSALALGVVYWLIVSVKISKQKAKRKIYWVVLWGFPLLVGLVFLLLLAPMSLKSRIMVSFYPEHDPKGGGWIGMNQKMVLESANAFGEADAMSEALTMFDEGTNFAFISILAHYGWVVSLGMVLTIVIFSIKLMRNASQIKDMYGKLIVVGISGLFIWQSLCNLLMNFNLGMKSNINLPFISYGCQDLMINMVCLALVLSVYRRRNILLDQN